MGFIYAFDGSTDLDGVARKGFRGTTSAARSASGGRAGINLIPFAAMAEQLRSQLDALEQRLVAPEQAARPAPQK